MLFIVVDGVSNSSIFMSRRGAKFGLVADGWLMREKRVNNCCPDGATGEVRCPFCDRESPTLAG